ncbi:MAG: acyltransferase [Hyphomonadaceae bacterium]|nr:acyltransferase [Hyphomonadaceae bacterium]
MGAQLHSIQILRAAAAMAVVLFHLCDSLARNFGVFPSNPFPAGSDGVDIFFVISGFIMCYTTARVDQRSPSDFAVKRVVRIIPIYYFLTLVLFVAGLALPSLLSSGGATLEQLAKSLLFIPYERANGVVAPVLFLGWTLNYEMFFYAIFTIALIAAPRFRIHFVLAVIATLAALGWIAGGSGLLVQFYTSGLLLEFAWGCLIFVIFDRYPDIVARLRPLWVIGLASLLIQNFYDIPLPREIEKGLPAALIVLSVLGISFRGGRLQSSISHIGDASYSLYLGHPYVIEVAGKLTIAIIGVSAISAAFVGIVSIVGSIGLALLSFRLLERPSNAWLRKQAFAASRKKPGIP